MRAMILAAGLGTRLRPLSLVRPKVLTPLRGVSILEFWLWRLHQAGIEAVVINAWHLQEQVAAAIAHGTWPIPVHVLVEPLLLGTGGGIANALSFFEGEPFLVINGDIVCDVSLVEVVRQFLDSGASAGLLMHDCNEFNNVAVDADGRIVGFGREGSDLVRDGSERKVLAFTGIHVLDPVVMSGVPPGRPWDILTVYRELIRTGKAPAALQLPPFWWRETGSLESYVRLHEELGRLEANALPPLPTGRSITVDPRAQISPEAELRGTVWVGAGSRVMAGAIVEDSILWEGIEVLAESRLVRCVVADGVVVAGVHQDEIITGLPQ